MVSCCDVREALAEVRGLCLLLLGQRGGGVHVLKCILLIPFE